MPNPNVVNGGCSITPAMWYMYGCLGCVVGIYKISPLTGLRQCLYPRATLHAVIIPQNRECRFVPAFIQPCESGPILDNILESYYSISNCSTIVSFG